jgi:RecJ-like exonuclease
LLKKIRELAKSFLEKSKDKEVLIISHNDTDGITSAAILAKTLQKLDKPFTLKIIKNLEEEIIKILPKDKIIIFLDLASNSLNKIKRAGLKDVFILDHHEITQEVPEGIEIANPHLENKKESLSGSCLTYLFSKEINKKDRSLARLAIIGMVGDLVEKDLTDLKNKILQDSEAVVKKSLLIYPATRPINKTLEYNSSIYLPGVTGSAAGASRFVMDTGIKKQGNKFKSLIELNEDEMKKLVTAIHLIINPTDEKNLIGNLFLVKFFNKIEDCREISALINACSRSGESGIAVALCLGNQQALKKARSRNHFCTK